MLFFLIPETERLESMLQYANSKTPMTYVYVPVTGSSVKYGIPSDEARKTTAALVHWLADLNLHGYSLNGNMTSADFGISRGDRLRDEQQLLKKVVESKEKCEEGYEDSC